jgi:deoxyribose-phosphate aldolase
MASHLAGRIDHTALKATTTSAEIARLCEEAIQYRFKAVCVPPYFVKLAAGNLAGSGIAVATVIGFPMGYSTTGVKVWEAGQAIQDGATEIDAVHNIAALRSSDWGTLEAEIRELNNVSHDGGALLKVILETGLLTDEEIVRCCKRYAALGVDFLKTSTGFSETGATTHAVSLMRANLPSSVRIKAAGGIRSFDVAQAMVEAGADRIGCSASIAIMAEADAATQN